LKVKLLVIEDDELFRQNLCWLLKDDYQILEAATPEEAKKLVETQAPEIILLDLGLPPQPNSPEYGLKLLSEFSQREHAGVTIVITGQKDKKVAYQAIEKGAYDYFIKPFEPEEIKIVIKRAVAKVELEKQRALLKNEIDAAYNFGEIIGQSAQMKEVFGQIKKVASVPSTVLITGESGTGKELVAYAIHKQGLRRDQPFIKVTCCALSEGILESELFGHEKGAFTGALQRRLGKFELANKGTIFLDEIGSISPKLQADLLRVLQEKSFERVGGRETIKVDVRIIAATNQDLAELVKKKEFREDLFYRLNVLSIHLPPLRERQEDIPLLITHFLKKYNQKCHRNIQRFSPEALKLLQQYSYPGNVRELENIIERLVVFAQGEEIGREDLPLFIRERESDSEERESSFEERVAQFEKELLNEAISKARGVKIKAAQILGITRDKMNYLLKKYNM
jgi:putative PEP-CTERM system response regulator